ncbi:hypothetical protein N0V88_007813 [Collariella sp. IMI 366227]|nr:hypothetical protein N0V88_007813 [Collariella sp. IMI 366227]
MTTTPLRLNFVTLDVFTDSRFEGNPLAIVFVPPAARSQLTQATKQRIADEFNLSETVFLHTLDSEPNITSSTRQIDIFTIGSELTFAGHPTIGSAHLVKHILGWTHITTLLTKAGPIPITSLTQEGKQARVRASIPHAVHIHANTLASLLTSPTAYPLITTGLSSDPDLRAAELAAPVVSIVRGMTFLLIELPSLEVLAKVSSAGSGLDFAKLEGLRIKGSGRGLVGSSVEEGGKKEFAVRTRMLAEGFEDPATGSAASALASYLTILKRAVEGARFTITQGVEMGRRSEIEVEIVARVDDGEVRIGEVLLGGTAVEVPCLIESEIEIGAIDHTKFRSSPKEDSVDINGTNQYLWELPPGSEGRLAVNLPEHYNHAMAAGETYTLLFPGVEVAMWDWGTIGEHLGRELKAWHRLEKDEMRPALLILGGAHVSILACEEETPWPERATTQAQFGFDKANLMDPEAPILTMSLECAPTTTLNGVLSVEVKVTYTGQVSELDGYPGPDTTKRPITFRTWSIIGLDDWPKGFGLYRWRDGDNEAPWEACNLENGACGFQIYDEPDVAVRVVEHEDFTTLKPGGGSWTTTNYLHKLPQDTTVGDLFLYGFRGVTVDWWDWGGVEEHADTVVMLPCWIAGRVTGPRSNGGRSKLVVTYAEPVEFRVVDDDWTIMLCALSGEVPEEPVVSKKTGTVFEKRLILKYIEENGKEPGTDEELDPEDLLPVKTSRVVRPRPPNFTSLPSLLKAFQDEWDALVLETYNTREQLARTREELATALYQHDAAVRVIARLTKERDEARDALSKVTVAPASVGAANGDAMAVDNEALPENLVEHVHEMQQQLMKGRKKRPIPQGWITPDEVAVLQQVAYTDLAVSHASSLDIESGYAAIGGLDGKVDIYSTQSNTVERSLDIGEPVTATVWTGSKGSVKVYDSGSETASFQVHAGAITGLSVHPGGRILASVGVDKSFVFYDLETLQKVSRGYTDAALTACAFHPDGNLFGAGTQSGDIKVFKTDTGEQAESFSLGSPVQTLVFSENGFWFAAAGKGQSTTAIFDLRKSGAAALVKELQTGDAQALAWDYTGQFLATAGSTGVTVQMYLKSAKAWSEPLRTSTPATAIRWGDEAKTLVTVSKEGVVAVLGVKE